MVQEIGLGRMKPYYCRGDYIWIGEDGEITCKSREEFKKKDVEEE